MLAYKTNDLDKRTPGELIHSSSRETNPGSPVGARMTGDNLFISLRLAMFLRPSLKPTTT